MKNTFFYICALYLMGIFSCQTKESDPFHNLKGTLAYKDSLRIQDDGFSFISMRNPVLLQDSILGFGDNTFRSINLFHSQNGKFLMTFERDSVDSFILPVKDMSLFDIESDTVYILNNLVSSIFVFTLEKEFVRKIDLNFPDDSMKAASRGIFEKRGNRFFISSVASYGGLREQFLYSELVSVFDLDGNFSHSFGSYPENYTHGKLVLSTNEHKVIKGDRLFILNVAGPPILKEYNLAGELQAFYPLSPPSFDTEIGFYQSDPFSAPLTDQMNGLALDPEDPRDILYASFHSFDTRERSSYGLSTYRWILLRIDLESKTILEVPLVGDEYLELSCELIPKVKGDTLHVLMRETDEALYLKRLVLAEAADSDE